MKKIISLLKKKKEVIMYLIFGGCTTIINFLAYFVFKKLGCGVSVSSISSWIAAVLFAYVTNKIFVFKSKKNTGRELLNEFVSFVSGRVFTGIFDLVFMILLVDVFHLCEPLIKILLNVIVIVLNFVISKLWTFKKATSNSEKK